MKKILLLAVLSNLLIAVRTSAQRSTGSESAARPRISRLFWRARHFAIHRCRLRKELTIWFRA